MKQIIIDSEAEIELSDSVAFYEQREPGLGLEFERAAREAVQTIQADPDRHPLQNDGTRRLVMERFPFVIHYADLPNTIWVLAFAHTSRKPGYWRGDSEPTSPNHALQRTAPGVSELGVVRRLLTRGLHARSRRATEGTILHLLPGARDSPLFTSGLSLHSPPMPRHDGRQRDQLRPISFTPNIAPHSTGSVLVAAGDTRVICSAMIEESIPNWMKFQKVSGGWLTAEYSMLPYSTLERKQRDSAKGRIDGRSVEIQRLIGRSLRAVVDLDLLGPRTLCIDCDVLQADGGTRTASITGACVAAALAVEKLLEKRLLTKSPIRQLVAAVSVGVVNGEPLLDLNYLEDKDASVDMNLVMTANGQFVEVQGSGEEQTFSESELAAMLALGKKGIAELIAAQRAAISSASAVTPEPVGLVFPS